MKRVCSRCKSEKDVNEFHKKHGKPQYTCKDCRKTLHRQHYLANKEKYLQQNRDRRRKFREEINELKNVPCMDCKNFYPAVCMEFDHRPDEVKVKEVALMVNVNKKKEVFDEIKKCDIVCSNCHRIRTLKRRSKEV